MLAERVGTDACRLAGRWKIDMGLAADLIDLDQWAAAEIQKAFPPWMPGTAWPGLFIISGQRSFDQNRRAGGARDSRHLGCPATAADLRLGAIVMVPGTFAEDIWALLGGKWKKMGHRWGGDFKWGGSPRPNPKEWNHFDLGHFVSAATAVPLRAVSRPVRVAVSPPVPGVAIEPLAKPLAPGSFIPRVMAPRARPATLRPIPQLGAEEMFDVD